MTVGEKSVNPLRDEASPLLRGNQKKKTRFAGLFFLTGLRPVLPLGQCPPSKPYTRQARHGQLAEQFYLFIQTPLATGEG